jgi:hypothetical protein
MIVVASRIASTAYPRRREGKFSKISSKLAPAARFSKSTPTGIRVPMNTGIPPMISGSEWTTLDFIRVALCPQEDLVDYTRAAMLIAKLRIGGGSVIQSTVVDIS